MPHLPPLLLPDAGVGVAAGGVVEYETRYTPGVPVMLR